MIKIMINLLSLLLSSVLWVQVPQWSDDWSKCAVDIPDASSHWYITAPDNTFGEGFDWASAPWFDANGLSDVPSIEKQTAIEKLQIFINTYPESEYINEANELVFELDLLICLLNIKF